MAAKMGINSVDTLVESTNSCVLQPKCFFVSWNGVLTLVYSGFPPALQQLKTSISQEFPGLPKENPGSLWPKTSLSALKDNQRLTPSQLKDLNEICKTFTAELTSLSQEDLRIDVKNLAIVVYECRCLERQLSKKTIQLLDSVDTQGPAPEQLAKVNQVVSESDQDEYWFFASKDGSRASHYQGVGLGATLVHELNLFGNDQQRKVLLADLLQRFKDRVEILYPGLYSWFSLDSLHCTIRGLVG